jgi:hypothetical protein
MWTEGVPTNNYTIKLALTTLFINSFGSPLHFQFCLPSRCPYHLSLLGSRDQQLYIDTSPWLQCLLLRGSGDGVCVNLMETTVIIMEHTLFKVQIQLFLLSESAYPYLRVDWMRRHIWLWILMWQINFLSASTYQ